jgi:hypothetical protein
LSIVVILVNINRERRQGQYKNCDVAHNSFWIDLSFAVLADLSHLIARFSPCAENVTPQLPEQLLLLLLLRRAGNNAWNDIARGNIAVNDGVLGGSIKPSWPTAFMNWCWW